MGDKTAVDGDLGVKGEGRRTRDRERERVWLVLPAHYLKLVAPVQTQRREPGIVIFI